MQVVYCAAALIPPSNGDSLPGLELPPRDRPIQEQSWPEIHRERKMVGSSSKARDAPQGGEGEGRLILWDPLAGKARISSAILDPHDHRPLFA